jgi:Bacterial regulatory helix-turn-helix protein, lysR family
MEQQASPYAQEVEQKSALAQSMRRFRAGTGRIAAPSGQHLDCSGAGENDFVSLRICPGDIDMELRHLRYFIAVAETGSLKFAAEKRLHTAQPSLSRQIRDLEREVGVPLLRRSVRGVELTAAGFAFLDHARLSVMQAEAAAEAARRAAEPAKEIFAVGFLTGQEVAWLAPTTRILSDELPNLEIRVSSGFSTTLADDLVRGRSISRSSVRNPSPISNTG